MKNCKKQAIKYDVFFFDFWLKIPLFFGKNGIFSLIFAIFFHFFLFFLLLFFGGVLMYGVCFVANKKNTYFINLPRVNELFL